MPPIHAVSNNALSYTLTTRGTFDASVAFKTDLAFTVLNCPYLSGEVVSF